MKGKAGRPPAALEGRGKSLWERSVEAGSAAAASVLPVAGEGREEEDKGEVIRLKGQVLILAYDDV